MYQNILLCTDGSAGARVAAEYAIWLTRRLQARLRALHITDIRLLEGPLLSDLAGALGAQPYSALVPQLQRIQQEKSAAILQAVEQQCGGAGAKAECIQATGSLVQVFLEQEQGADLVVMGQRGEHSEWASESLGSSVERMVRASTKPCLVCAGAFREIKRLLVAYDGSDESSCALRRGIELAEALGLQMMILTAYESPDERAAAERVIEQARLQAVNRKLEAETRVLDGNAEELIIAECKRIKADLIVMGAYGHTRIREWILGSTTAHVLRQTPVPLLLSRHGAPPLNH